MGTVPCTGTFEGVVTTAATCVAAGVMTYTCEACGASYTEDIPVDENAHKWGEPVAVEGKAPTCGTDGTGLRTCELCKKTEEVVMPATGEHTYDEESLTCTLSRRTRARRRNHGRRHRSLEALPAAEDITGGRPGRH